MATERGLGLIVGVDFGTTFSGLSYAYTAEPNPEVVVVKDWPQRGRRAIHTRDAGKVPTEIAYQLDGRPHWGYEIMPGEYRYSNFKLGLEERTPETRYDDPRLNHQIVLPTGKTAGDVCADYLELLNAHLLNVLEKDLGHCLVLADTPIHYILTTPAAWSPLAQERTRDAASRAGMGSRPRDTLTMTTEPLAAATYALKELENSIGPGREAFVVGNRILVCDAGGGTVDLITYSVERVKPLRIKEIVGSKGGRCGSVSIDKEYLAYVAAHTADYANWSSRRTDRGSNLMTQFVTEKRTFQGHRPDDPWDNDPILLRIGVGDDLGVGVLSLTDQDMAGLFAPTLDRVRELILEQLQACIQVDRKVERIFLVGGFGESPYLYEQLQQWMAGPLEAELAENARLVNPRHTWTAIVRGAALHGLENAVTTRVLNQHYGVWLNARYDENKHGDHSEDCIYFDKFDEHKMTRDNVVWFAEKRSAVGDDTEFKIPFWFQSTQSAHLKLMTCSLDTAPSRKSDPCVHVAGDIVLDVTNIPKSEYQTKTIGKNWFGGGGTTLYEARALMVVNVGNGGLSFKCTTNDGRVIPQTAPRLALW